MLFLCSCAEAARFQLTYSVARSLCGSRVLRVCNKTVLINSSRFLFQIITCKEIAETSKKTFSIFHFRDLSEIVTLCMNVDFYGGAKSIYDKKKIVF